MPGNASCLNGPAHASAFAQRHHRNLLRFALALSRRRRQRRDLPQHAGEQPPRQMALRQQQPVVPGMLDEPSAGLHQPLLQAGAQYGQGIEGAGTVANLAQRTPSREEFNEFIGAEEATQLAEKYRIV